MRNRRDVEWATRQLRLPQSPLAANAFSDGIIFLIPLPFGLLILKRREV